MLGKYQPNGRPKAPRLSIKHCILVICGSRSGTHVFGSKRHQPIARFSQFVSSVTLKHDTEDLPDIVRLKELECEFARGEIPNDAFVLLTADVQKYEFYWMIIAN